EGSPAVGKVSVRDTSDTPAPGAGVPDPPCGRHRGRGRRRPRIRPGRPPHGAEHQRGTADLAATGMHLRGLDKDAAIRVERQARAEARRQAEAAAQQAAILEYAAALADARAATAAGPGPAA